MHANELRKFLFEIYEPIDGQSGVRIKNLSIFSGCVGEVQSKNASFAASTFTFNDERMSVIDYSYPLMSESQIIIFQNPLPKSHWWNPFLSFKASVWALTFGSMTFVSILAMGFCKWGPLSAWNLKLKFAVKDEIQFGEHLWASTGAFLMQVPNFYAYPISSRFVTASWWILTAILHSIYAADLTSILTIDNERKLPSTLQGVVDSEEITLHLSSGYAITAYLKSSNDPVLQALYSKSKFVPQCYDLLLNSKTQNVACIADNSQMSYIKSLNCSRFTIMPEIVKSTLVGFFFPKLVDFKNDFDREIQLLADKGVIRKWFLEDLSNSTCGSQNYVPIPINFDKSAGIYFVTLIIYLFAFILLLLELILESFTRKPNTKKAH